MARPSGREFALTTPPLDVCSAKAVGAGATAMTNPFESEDGEFLVVVNDEGQYSLWPSTLHVPAGWSLTGPRGARGVCLAWIDEHWTDMRPRSLARQMEKDAAARTAGE